MCPSPAPTSLTRLIPLEYWGRVSAANPRANPRALSFKRKRPHGKTGGRTKTQTRKQNSKI